MIARLFSLSTDGYSPCHTRQRRHLQTKRFRILSNNCDRKEIRNVICAIAEQHNKLNKASKPENASYVSLFFAAPILGENPQAFGLTSPPLSSFGPGH
jgi:hypothetical protein